MAPSADDNGPITIKMLNPDGSVTELALQDPAIAVKLSEHRSVGLCSLENGDVAVFLANKEYADGEADSTIILKPDTARRLWQLLTVVIAGAELQTATPIMPKETTRAN